MNTTTKFKTFRELQAFIATLDETQLDEPVRIWQDDESPACKIHGATILDVDYINDDGEITEATGYDAEMLENTEPYANANSPILLSTKYDS